MRKHGKFYYDETKPDGEFVDYRQWVAKARSWLGGISGGGTKYKKKEHVICRDARDRLCAIGADFMRARDENAFPVRWFNLI